MLYVVPTPVGNLEDITLRASRILSEVSLIVAEDTRTSSILLKHLAISKPMIAYHKFNEHATVEKLVAQMVAGQDIALISDAGTPGISDPGYLLVKKAVDNDVEVTCLPGATAFVPALVASALPNDKFIFYGFIPQKKKRLATLQNIAAETHTVVLYESPHRLAKTLTQLAEIAGAERLACVSREISKKFETHHRGTLGTLSEYFVKNAPKGEIVITLAAASFSESAANDFDNENED